MTASQLAQHFRAKRVKEGCYMARCRSHDDRAASLSIRQKKGKAEVHCFAGCSGQEIMAAVGLRLSDLYPDTPLTPEARLRFAEERRLEQLEYRHGWAIVAKVVEPERRAYWQAAIRGIETDLVALRMKHFDWKEESLRYAEAVKRERDYVVLEA